MPSARGEVVVPLRMTAGHVAPVTHVRSTLLVGSIQTIRARGFLDAYLKSLPQLHHDTILHAVAGNWIPVEVAQAHYAAADAMGLGANEIFDIGREVGDRVQASMLGTLVRSAAKGVGVTPWMGLEQFQRMWDRVLLGGAGAVFKLGPKEARVESHGNPLVQWPYFRHSWRGIFAGAGALFCQKLYVTEVSVPLAPMVAPFVMRLAWV